MAARLRPGSQKKLPKEKIVQLYESVLRGEDVQSVETGYWDEMLLLRPRVHVLDAELNRLSTEQLHALHPSLSTLTTRCVDAVCGPHLIRCAHALQTLSALLLALSRRARAAAPADCCRQPGGTSAAALSVLLPDAAAAGQLMDRLYQRCAEILTAPQDELRCLALDVLLAAALADDDISENVLLGWLMCADCALFEPLMQLLCDAVTRARHGHKCVLLLTLLVNYGKHQRDSCDQLQQNPYTVQLSLLDDELALNGLSQVITAALAEFNWKYTAQRAAGAAAETAGWLSSITNMVGSIFAQDEHAALRSADIQANQSVLLALYEAVHLSRNFIGTLTQAATDASQPPSPINSLDRHTAASGLDPAPPPLSQPVNLLVAFLEYCSIVMQHTKTETAADNVRQCFIVLTCVAEDQYCNSLIHDANLVFSVHLHRMPMRHRKLYELPTPPQPLANALLDLCIEFILSHLMKRFPTQLHLQCVGLVHRLLCYQKRCRVRLNYGWRQLWAALVALLKFLVANESVMLKRSNTFQLAIQVVNIFNLFITYGDTFLPTPASYDELYYELVRMSQVFTNLYAMSLRYAGEDEAAGQLSNNLVNIRAICNHFSPKIDAWLQVNGLTSPSEQQVLDLVRSNYESLTLKLQEGLDLYLRYSESPQHTEFFSAMVRSVIRDASGGLQVTELDHAQLLAELSQIS